MEAGQKGTCRYCGESLVLVHEFRRWHDDWNGPLFWRHEDLDRGQCQSAWDDPGVHCANTDNRVQAPHGLPREWCWWQKDDGHHCQKAVRDENLAGHFYACGVHMKKFVFEMETRARRLKMKDDEEARQAMEEWEFDIYQEAMGRLHMFNPELFPNETIRDVYGKRLMSSDHYIKVDIADLERYIRELTAYAPSGGRTSLWEDDDSLQGLFEQPQEAG
jgi:hypothetical protein